MHSAARNLAAKVRAGKPVVGQFLVEFGGPAVVHVMAAAGFDFLMIDCEHGNYGPREVEAMLDAGRGAEICIFVRPPHTARDVITRSLDAGAGGLIIPAVDTMEQVHQVVRAAKYRPVGRRGVHLFRGHNNHRRVDPETFMAEANRDVLTFIQIELAGALDIVEQIAATDGVDGLYVGPGDLSVDLGVPGQWDGPLVLDAVRRVAAAGREHGKIVACHADDINVMPALRDMGVQVFGFFCDLAMFAKTARESVDVFRSVVGE